MNAIATTAPTWLAYGEMERLAIAIAKSGLFGIRTPEQAIVLMQIAQAEGRHPALAARDYDIIQGRPAKKAEAMHRDFLAGGGKVEWTTLTDDTADATFSHPQGGTARIIWDTDRAALAGLEKKDNWKKYPRQMLRNRVVSEGVRTVWPMATSGFHLPEEVGDATGKPANDADFNGTTLEGEPDAREQISKELPLKAGAAATARSEQKTAATEPGWREVIADLTIDFNAAQDLAAVNRLIARDDVQMARRNFKGPAAAALDGLIARAVGSHGRDAEPEWTDTTDDPLPPPNTPEREWYDIAQELDQVETLPSHARLALAHSERILGWKVTHPELYAQARAAFEGRLQMLRATA